MYETRIRLATEVSHRNFVTKDGPHLDILKKVLKPDFEYPPYNELKFDVHIIGVVYKQGVGEHGRGFNYILSNGNQSNLEL